jgi:hypothetical protein
LIILRQKRFVRHQKRHPKRKPNRRKFASNLLFFSHVRTQSCIDIAQTRGSNVRNTEFPCMRCVRRQFQPNDAINPFQSMRFVLLTRCFLGQFAKHAIDSNLFCMSTSPILSCLLRQSLFFESHIFFTTLQLASEITGIHQMLYLASLIAFTPVCDAPKHSSHCPIQGMLTPCYAYLRLTTIIASVVFLYSDVFSMHALGSLHFRT